LSPLHAKKQLGLRGSAAFRRTSSRPADFLHDSLAMQTNVIHCAHEIGVRKLLFLGLSCIYPRLAPQPIQVRVRAH
jgi:nucleoside-diphosphate-sugar epimerase